MFHCEIKVLPLQKILGSIRSEIYIFCTWRRNLIICQPMSYQYLVYNFYTAVVFVISYRCYNTGKYGIMEKLVLLQSLEQLFRVPTITKLSRTEFAELFMNNLFTLDIILHITLTATSCANHKTYFYYFLLPCTYKISLFPDFYFVTLLSL